MGAPSPRQAVLNYVTSGDVADTIAHVSFDELFKGKVEKE